MAELTKEWLKQTIAEYEANRDELPFGLDTNSAIELQAFKLALASLEAEAMTQVLSSRAGNDTSTIDKALPEGTMLYTAPPAQVSVPDELTREEYKRRFMEDDDFDDTFRGGWKAHRAAMLQGAERVTTANKLPAIGWLRADYQDDNRGLRGNAPLFVLGKKDPSSVWGLDYIPLTAKYPVIPDGWVACSERMPKKGQEVLCTDQFENYETALYDTGYIPGPPFFATTAGEFHPTHWMPLPASPQQK